MTDIDQIGLVLDAGLRITAIVRDNGWKYFRIQEVIPTSVDGAYIVRYLFSGHEKTAVISGYEIETLETEELE